jgi:tRNA A-37 threonylcarbamoyl transferase component Bud32
MSVLGSLTSCAISQPAPLGKNPFDVLRDLSEAEVVRAFSNELFSKMSKNNYVKIRKCNPEKDQDGRSSVLLKSLIVVRVKESQLRFFRTCKNPEILENDKCISVPEGMVLGLGQTKTVFQSVDLLTEESFVVGQIFNRKPFFSGAVAALLREYEAGNALRDIPHCCPLEAIANNGVTKLFAISSQCPGTRLDEAEDMELSDQQTIILTVVDTIAKMHERGWVHQDPSKSNIIASISTPKSVFMIDFEHARKIDEEIQNTQRTNGGILRDLFILQRMITAIPLQKTSFCPSLTALEEWYEQQRSANVKNLGKHLGVYPAPDFLKGRFTTFVRNLHTELLTLFTATP